jgi:asparagine synthase (glutamine-hydrolysing)
LKNRIYEDLTRATLPSRLRALDRQSLAFDVEPLSPFLDVRLVEFMFRVPGGLKIRDGVTGALLRRAIGGLLPERARAGLRRVSAPDWCTGAARTFLMDLVESRAFRERGTYDAAEVRRRIDEHDTTYLWRLVNLETWLRWCDAGFPP